MVSGHRVPETGMPRRMRFPIVMSADDLSVGTAHSWAKESFKEQFRDLE